MAENMPNMAFVPLTGQRTITKQAAQFNLLLDELAEQQNQVYVLLDQLAQVEQSNDHLVGMQQMLDTPDTSMKEHSAWLRDQAEQQIISLAVLEGYVLQQRDQLHRIKQELEHLQADLAEQQRALLKYQAYLKELPDA